MNVIVDYFVANYLEIIAAALGVIAVFLQIRINSFYWIISILNVGLYIGVYISEKLYALMLLMVYYILMSIYGWFTWQRGKRGNKQQEELSVSYTNLKTWFYLIIIAAAAFVLVVWVLTHFTDSNTPVLDALVTTLSFVATWMLARKKIENWCVWFVADIISCGLYYTQNMLPTLILYVFLSVMAVIGFYSWKKTLNQSNA